MKFAGSPTELIASAGLTEYLSSAKKENLDQFKDAFASKLRQCFF